MSSIINYCKESLKNDEVIEEKLIERVNDELLFDKKTESIYSILEDISMDTYYKSLPDKLKFSTNFSKSGKQGVLGLLDIIDDEDQKDKKLTKNNDKKCVYKISQHINFLVDQEYTILNNLSVLREYCPHFCRSYGKLKVKVNSEFRNVENPFKLNGRYNIYNDILLLEYIENARKFYRYIKKEEIEEEVLYSIVKQTLLALDIAQKKKGLSHYDLHSNNVLIKTCDPNSVFLYILDENTQYAVPTYGYYPVIIDFGFGYCKDMEGGPLYGALAHTDVGFMTHMNDKIADPKLFLVTVSDEIKKYRGSKKSKLFRKLVKNIFEPLAIDFESGWDLYDGKNCSDMVYSIVKIENKRTPFFREYGHYCIDLLQTLITLPIKRRKYKENNLQDLYKIIIEEFKRIEDSIGSHFFLLYLFKACVESASKLKNKYINSQDDELKKVVKSFKHDVLERVNDVSKYSMLSGLDWENLLGSMIGFASQMEGFIYEKLSPRLKEKEVEYEEMDVKNIEEMYEAIEINIPGHFPFDSETQVYVWDAFEEKSCKLFSLPISLIHKINKQHPIERGRLLYSYYQKIKND